MKMEEINAKPEYFRKFQVSFRCKGHKVNVNDTTEKTTFWLQRRSVSSFRKFSAPGCQLKSSSLMFDHIDKNFASCSSITSRRVSDTDALLNTTVRKSSCIKVTRGSAKSTSTAHKLLQQEQGSQQFRHVTAARSEHHTKLRRSRIASIAVNEAYRKKCLLAKFRRAVKLTIFCCWKFKQHCLRINEHQDELAPYIQRLHFHEDENNDLLIDLTKFKANRQMRISEEIKKVLSKEVSERTEHEIYSVTLALSSNKSFSEYPKRMQKKIAQVGLYEKYDSKRMIVRQGHPASAFYFILSGTVVVMVMEEEDSKYARPVAHLHKGQTFGELAIINGSKRNSTVIAKETCEFMSISIWDYHKIFMAGGVRNINDPDQEAFLKSLSCLAEWPIHKLQEHTNQCQFLFFKHGEVIVRNSRYCDWLIIVKSGTVHVLKKLKRVGAFEWKKKKAAEIDTVSEKRELITKRTDWRRVLSEVGIALNPDINSQNVEFLSNGKPIPFEHPEPEEECVTEITPRKGPQLPNLWPFRVDVSEIESGHYLEDQRGVGLPVRSRSEEGNQKERILKQASLNSIRTAPTACDRSNSILLEEEEELLGNRPHIRTIIEDLNDGMGWQVCNSGFRKRFLLRTMTNSDEEELITDAYEISVQSAVISGLEDDNETINEADLNPEFVHVQTLTKGHVFGLADLLFGDQPSFSIVSRGADCLLINKHFYMEHASEKLLRDMKYKVCPYPTEQELQDRLQVSVDWQAYKKTILSHHVEHASVRRHMRSTVRGTKVQEAF